MSKIESMATCPYCNGTIEYGHQLDSYYDDDMYSVHWSGYCFTCQRDVSFWENYKLVSRDYDYQYEGNE